MMLDAPGLSGALLVLIATAVGATATLIAVRQWRDGRVAVWIPAAIAAGTAGNLADRMLFGGVRDWLAVGSIRLNLADVFLAIGIPVIVIAGFRARSRFSTN